ncbi:hypothetical protein MBORA_08820 [Methanobrevibacter oralis]|uniref:Inner membrane protein n=1 Tax=Methanobrevibacter oralis TaxID=66851 RepID=A0A166B7P2_METOA|nr:DUF1819 family protein [Methanobrevibacter oralis]KZX12981.1 hypothetical protein MBORA_08820 [Methanobrevibacter oralis]
MKYSAGIKNISFWLLESKLTAEYILDGLSKEEILDLSLNENLYQVESQYKVKDIPNRLFTRLKDFSEESLTYFINCDVNSSKLFVIISILRNDKLFFEFVHEVFREHILLGNYALKQSDFDIFFMNKSNQSKIIGNWTEETVNRVQRQYRFLLKEAGLIEKDDNEYKIIIPFIDYRLKDLMIKENLTPYLNAITGEG